MSTIAERHARLHFRLKAETAATLEQHFYTGSHNVWYGEVSHDCECGFSSPGKAEVLAHVAEQSLQLRCTTESECGQQPATDEQLEQMRVAHYELSTGELS